MKNLIILGVSGSIGRQTVAIVKNNPNDLSIIGVSVHQSLAYLEELLCQFPSIKYVCVGQESDSMILSKKYPNIRFFFNEQGLLDLVQIQAEALVVNALVGFVGLMPTITAFRSKKSVALANKETLVCAGELVEKERKQAQVNLYPIDSEHSALRHCLQGERIQDVKRIYITGSGGPFRDLTLEELKTVTKQQALKHPTWQMGQKITIDSATLMNKALEIIEAHYLFNVPYEQIEAILHYESIVHAIVEFKNGSLKASLGQPSMEIPIVFALGIESPNVSPTSYFDFKTAFQLRFKPFDLKRFEAIDLAYRVGRLGGTMPCVFNAANEIAVHAFLEDKIKFYQIIDLVKKTLDAHQCIANPTLSDILAADQWARKQACELISML